MFCVPCRRHKIKCQDGDKVGDLQSSSTKKWGKGSKQQNVVLHTPATSDTTVSTPEPPKEKAKKRSWWRRLFRRKKKSKNKTAVKEDVAGPSSSATENTENTKKELEEASPIPDTSGRKVVVVDTNQPSSATENRESEAGEADVREASSTPDTQAAASSELQPEHKEAAEDTTQASSATEERENTDGESEAGDVQEAAETPDVPATTSHELQPEHKEAADDTDQSSSATEENENTNKDSEDGEGEVQEASSSPDTPLTQAAASLELQPEEENIADNANLSSSATEKSVRAIKESEDEADVQDASSSLHSPVTAVPELQSETEDVAEDTNLPTSVTEISVRAINESEDDETSSTPNTPDTALPELQPETEDVAEDTTQTSAVTDKSALKESENTEAGFQEPFTTTDTQGERKKERNKAPWWRLWFLCKVDPSAKEDNGVKSSSKTADVDSADKSNTNDAAAKTDGLVPSGVDESLKEESNKTGLWTILTGHFHTSSRKCLSREELNCLGFPNLAQTCYMNSTLQALLTLRPFIQEVNSHRKWWRSHAIIKGFVELGVCRLSNNDAMKKSVLAAFKRTIAEFNAEFQDHNQKDAHEFLSCVLDLMRSHSQDLQKAAVDMSERYTCPVSAHITFQMLSTRTCSGCQIQSMRVEDYTNLSLDLVPRGSVRQCLEEYLKEDQLSYRCECGALTSSQKWSFLTLPNVLILQLKRFRFRKFYLEKVNSPVFLSRELLVNVKSSSTEQTTARYSLVSIVSHLGSTAHSGHYVCDSAYKKEQGGATDCWLTFNDKHVSETDASVCHKRQGTAYLLFYEKQQ